MNERSKQFGRSHQLDGNHQDGFQRELSIAGIEEILQ